MAGKGGGGAWKVAYADFVTAMMAFFLVMWITAQSKPVKQAIAQYFSDPLGNERGSTSKPSQPFQGSPTVGPHASGRGDGKGAAKGAPKSLPDPDPNTEEVTKLPKLQMFSDPIATRSTGTMILFADGSAELDQQARQQLGALVPRLLGKPNKIEIRGHTSGRPLPPGSEFQNAWQLSYARCVATMKYLTSQGISPEHIRLSQCGTFEPYTVRRDDAWQAQNSRVEVFATSEYRSSVDKTRLERGGFFGDPPTAASEKPEREHAESPSANEAKQL